MKLELESEKFCNLKHKTLIIENLCIIENIYKNII